MPCQVSDAVVLRRPFFRQQSLCLCVTSLLFQIATKRTAAVMPHNGRRRKTDGPATLLQSPTNIDIISRDAKPWVEASDLEQPFTSIGHVAARDMLGHAIRKQNVNRTSGRICDAIGDS